MGRSLVWLLAIQLLLVTTSQAQESTSISSKKMTARQLFLQGNDAMQRGDHPSAIAFYRRSEKLFPATTARLALARALVANGQLVEAFETHKGNILRGVNDAEPAAFRQALQLARKELAALKPRVPSLVIVLRGTQKAHVTLDGSELPAEAWGIAHYVNPGQHRLLAKSAGFLPVERTVSVVEGTTQRVVLELKAVSKTQSTASPPQTTGPKLASTSSANTSPDKSTRSGWSSMRIAGVATGAVGILGLLGYGVTGGLVLAKKNEALEDCKPHPNTPDRYDCQTQNGLDAARAASDLAMVNTVLFFGGLAAAGTGLTLFLLDQSQDSERALLAPILGPDVVGLSARGLF